MLKRMIMSCGLVVIALGFVALGPANTQAAEGVAVTVDLELGENCKKCGPDCEKACCAEKTTKKCGVDCKKECCAKADKKCGADCKKECCSKSEKKCGADCKKECCTKK